MLDQTSQQPFSAAAPPAGSGCTESPSLQRHWTLSCPTPPAGRSPLCHSQNQTAAHPIRRRCLPDTGRQRRLFLFLLRHSVCFSVAVWTSPLSSSFRRSLSSVRRENRSAPLAVVPSESTAKSSKVDCVDKGLTRPQVMQRLSPPTVALICWFSFLT